VSKTAVVAACNWLMAGIGLTICFFAFAGIFQSSSPSEWASPSQQDQHQVSVPSSRVPTPPAQVEMQGVSRAVSTLATNVSAGGEQPATNKGVAQSLAIDNGGAQPAMNRGAGGLGPADASSERLVSQAAWGNAPYAVAPSVPAPTANRALLPPGMENEDNSMNVPIVRPRIIKK
jgi:hypothetical protein